jgi:hypothetical protein
MTKCVILSSGMVATGVSDRLGHALSLPHAHQCHVVDPCRDESGSDWIIPLPQPHPYFLPDVERSRYYTDAVTDADFFGYRIWRGVGLVEERMQINIVG